MLKKFGVLSLLALPMVTLAAQFDQGDYIGSILSAAGGWISTLVPLLIALAIVVFFFYIVKYIWGGADDKSASKSGIIWSVVAIAVMVSIWGLVGLLQGVVGVDGTDAAPVVDIPTID